jgi:hypothetical protein
MNQKQIMPLVTGVLLGLAVSWLLGFWNHPPAAEAVAPVAEKTAASPAKTVAALQPVVKAQVALPTLPPSPVQQSVPISSAPATQTPAPSPEQAAAMAEIQQQSRVKAITNNLRQLSSAAEQYMLDKGVTGASYYDLVGNGTDDYIRSINPVMGEDYSGFYLTQEQTQVMIVAPDGTMVIFNL